MIAREWSKEQAKVIRCDVTSEQSVRQTFETLLAHWGGLDILVNAAGIAPPYALVDMPADKWRTRAGTDWRPGAGKAAARGRQRRV